MKEPFSPKKIIDRGLTSKFSSGPHIVFNLRQLFFNLQLTDPTTAFGNDFTLVYRLSSSLKLICNVTLTGLTNWLFKYGVNLSNKSERLLPVLWNYLPWYYHSTTSCTTCQRFIWMKHNFSNIYEWIYNDTKMCNSDPIKFERVFVYKYLGVIINEGLINQHTLILWFRILDRF